MTWFLFTLLSTTTLAIAELVQQRIQNTKNNIDERVGTTLTFLIQALITIPFILSSPLRNSLFSVFALNIFPYFLLVSFISSIGMIFYFKSLKVKNISFSTLFISVSVLVSTSLGIVLFSEGMYFAKLLGIFLVLFAIASININNFHLERNHFYGLLAGIVFGITYTIDKGLMIKSIHPLIYIFWAFNLVAFFSFIIRPVFVYKSIIKSSLADLRPVIISGIAYFLFNFFTFNAYRYGGEVGRVDAINNSQIFIIILVEYFIFHHREGLFRKLITAAIAFTGILILGYF